MKVGFTGTRRGMTIKQWKTFADLILELNVTEWHDGDCIGADAQANGTVWRFKQEIAGFFPYMVGHPCNIAKARAYCEYDETRDIYPPLTRDKHIVKESDVMFATPDGYEELFRGSGTWATIRYARADKKPLTIIWPDGTFERERWQDVVDR